MPQAGPFVSQPYLTAVAVAVRDRKKIYSQVLPRVPVYSDTFKYTSYEDSEILRIPDGKVGRTSPPNRVDWASSETTGVIEDVGYDLPLPQRDLDAQGANAAAYRAKKAAMLADQVERLREKRCADLVFAAGTYPTANKVTLTNANNFTDPATDVIALVRDALMVPRMRPNVAVFGAVTWEYLIRHPQIVKGFHGNSGDAGVATMDYIRALFGLETVLVGEAQYTSSDKGVATQTYGYIWGDDAAFLYINPAADTGDLPTFGFTADWTGRLAGTIQDADVGAKGGERLRVADFVKETVCGSSYGYFMADAGLA